MDSINPEKLYRRSKEIFRLQQIKREWIPFICFLKKIQPKTILEIGTYAGGSTYTFCRVADMVISIDCNNQLKPKRIKLIASNTHFIFIGKASDDPKALHKVKKKLKAYNKSVDLLFIDGDHTYKGAKKDFHRFSPLVRPGGHIVLHDINKTKYHIQLGCLVYKFWEELKEQYPNHQEITANKDWGGIGIIQIPHLKT